MQKQWMEFLKPVVVGLCALMSAATMYLQRTESSSVDGTVGHHPNCKCIFTLTQSPVSNGVYTGADFGARKQLRSNSNALDGVSTADLRTLASKRKLRSRGITNDALRKSILKSYMK